MTSQRLRNVDLRRRALSERSSRSRKQADVFIVTRAINQTVILMARISSRLRYIGLSSVNCRHSTNVDYSPIHLFYFTQKMILQNGEEQLK